MTYQPPKHLLEVLQKIQYEFSPVSFRMNQLVYKENTPIEFVYLVKEGEVEVCFAKLDRSKNQEHTNLL